MLAVSQFNQIVLSFVEFLVGLSGSVVSGKIKGFTDAHPLVILTFVRDSLAPFHDRIVAKDATLFSDPTVLSAFTKILPIPVDLGGIPQFIAALSDAQRSDLAEKFSAVWMASQIVSRLS